MEGKYPPIQGLGSGSSSSLCVPGTVLEDPVHCLMPAAFPSAQWDQKLPQDGPWKFFCQAMTLVLLLLVLILGVVLAEVLQFSNQMEEDLKQMHIKFVQGLADAGHQRDIMWGEVFRQTEAMRAGNESSCEPCHENWTAFQGSCYQFSTERKSWFQARDYCTEKNAHLVIINSQAEQKFLSPKGNNHYWIGLRKQYPQGIYKWQDGSVPTFINWRDTTSSEYDCAYLMNLGSWFSSSCYTYWYYWICEKPQVC
ncbi:C-type lectin domain family 4 member G-like isoform X2 [Suricata suricatta]|uniref:C-type lectin domain-containing protein n=1 Tax=Suricata suricatta TaxID=37032 RepID=A0A673TJM5_SURSU|nr:C-type lectin domain family 4 member G-like isoform X2 [Suricata suricatta]